MGWFGKAIGGSIGFFFGGPLGAILGAAVGHQFDKAEGQPGAFNEIFTPVEKSQAVFFVSTFSLFAKLARADGKVSKAEIDTVDHFIREQLKLDNDAREMAIKIFNVARDSTEPFEGFAYQFYSIFHNDRQMLRTMIDLMMRIAVSDGALHPAEELIIKTTAVIFNLGTEEFDRIKSIYHNNTDKYYSILGASKTDSDDEIKSKYRNLVKENHPDKVIAKGMPEEFVKYATEKFKEIQEAYEYVIKERKAV